LLRYTYSWQTPYRKVFRTTTHYLCVAIKKADR
jgi:hypothetical protein